MKRNINLYRSVDAVAVEQPRATTLLLAWSAAIAMIAVTQWWLAGAADDQDRAVAALRDKVVTTEAQLNALAATRMAGADDELQLRLAEVLGELDMRESILNLVSGHSTGDINGFSAQLRSLARQHAAGVWLTRVRVAAPGARTTLEGHALSPEIVPVYLRRLSVEQALTGQRFDLFEIDRPADDDGVVRFALNRAPVTAVLKP